MPLLSEIPGEAALLHLTGVVFMDAACRGQKAGHRFASFTGRGVQGTEEQLLVFSVPWKIK
jgi:hypothetical protein